LTDAAQEGCDWSVAVGVSAFREELSVRSATPERGPPRLREEAPSVIPGGEVAARCQGAGMPYMFVSTQIRLVCIPHLSFFLERRARFVYLPEQNQSGGPLRLQLCRRNIPHAGNSQADAQRAMCGCCFLPGCPKSKTHVPQLSPSC